MMVIQQQRCDWCTRDALYVEYHDCEWGRPVSDDTELFERLALESMQAGLSWITVLKKRETMRECFQGFDIEWLAAEGLRHIPVWMNNPGLIRHSGKLTAMVNNAQIIAGMQAQDLQLSKWLWSFAPAVHVPRAPGTVPAHTPEAQAMARALKKQGFRFVGPTTCYALMQSVGMVNDHRPDCFVYDDCADLWCHKLRPQ